MSIGDAVNTVKNAVADLLGLDTGEAEVSWADRILEATYTSASGKELKFYFEDLETQIEKKTSVFDFPDVDGSYVQDHGLKGRRFPMRCIFWGKDCDVIAQGFQSMLEERGYGKLQHPIHGDVDVIPFGVITRRDDLVTAANQVIFEFAFYQTLRGPYPSTELDPLGAMADADAAFADALAAQQAHEDMLNSPLAEQSFLAKLQANLQAVNNVVSALAEVQQEIADEVAGYTGLIDTALATAGEAINVAYDVKNLLNAPARAAALWSDKLDAYGNLINGLTDNPSPTPDDLGALDFIANDMYAQSAVAGLSTGTAATEFGTRAQALNAAVDLEEQMNTVATWREDNFVGLGDYEGLSVVQYDYGQSYAGLLALVAVTMDYLQKNSLLLKQERAIVLGEPRSIVDLCGELYGEVDDKLDFFIDSNNLTGEEILELPKGRRVAYYV